MNIKQKIKLYTIKFPLVYNISQKIYNFFFPASQLSIQEQIEKTFRKKPSVFFVQVGSNDGVQGDPIHGLITKSKEWTGMFIEPVGLYFQRLKHNYENADRFIFENVAIGTERETKRFYYVLEEAKTEFDDLPYWYNQLGSFDKNHILKQLGDRLEPYIVEEEIECFPIQEIFDRNNVKTIDFLHIDTEGFDYKVLSQVDFDRYKPLIVLYEHVHLSADDREKAKLLLKTSGYRLVRYGFDTLAIKASAIWRILNG